MYTVYTIQVHCMNSYDRVILYENMGWVLCKTEHTRAENKNKITKRYLFNSNSWLIAINLETI